MSPLPNDEMGLISHNRCYDMISESSHMDSFLLSDSEDENTATGPITPEGAAALAALATIIDTIQANRFSLFSSEEMIAFNELRSDMDRLKQSNHQKNLLADKLIVSHLKSSKPIVMFRDTNRLTSQIQILEASGFHSGDEKVVALRTELGKVERELEHDNIKLEALYVKARSFDRNEGDDEASGSDCWSDYQGSESIGESSSPSSGGGEDDSSNSAVKEDSVESQTGPSSACSFVSDSSNYAINVDTVFRDDQMANSRRVLLSGIPADATITQVANAVAGLGGIIKLMIHDSLKPSTVYKNALVEFCLTTSAQAYVQNIEVNGLELVDATGHYYDIQVELINTDSGAVSMHGHPHGLGIALGSQLSGRCITLADFPISAIWQLLSSFGPRRVVRVSIEENANEMTGVLAVEVATTFEAGRLCSMVLMGYFGPYQARPDQLGFGLTPSDRDVQEITNTVSNVIEHVPADQLETQWNAAPFNTFVQTQNFQYGSAIPRRSLASAPSPTKAEVLEVLESNDPGPRITLQDVSPVCRMRQVPATKISYTHVEETQKYVIVEGRIYTRGILEEVYTEIEGASLAKLKQDKLGKAKWRFFWGVYCEVNGLEDLRKYAEYGRIAAIRRKLNEKFGNPAWFNPERLQIPAFITAYLNPTNRNTIQTNE
ncbi:hypothetical protein F53441_2173 [Fusarium austroafricanum]|uniref:RRM domain-containing protein n=1 Tax=Fusarium austroafricanum TaxID=2364996 RepID=A0A8H4KRY9_9HYPO|nr:hypothetical protein F53441_2173 [Fusarium austroafricanum]